MKTGILIACFTLFGLRLAHAEPYLAVQQGLRCAQCHANPTGGGLRNSFGNGFALTQMAATQLDAGAQAWLGQVTNNLSLGGDIRATASELDVPNSPAQRAFELAQARLYVDVAVIANRLNVYVDQLLAPGSTLNREAFVRYTSASGTVYVKAGRMYLPFGFRLQDDTAFVRQASGINMNTPDTGVEFGWESNRWSLQAALSNGAGGGTETDTGKQLSLQGAYVQSRWRLGVGGNYNDSELGDRAAVALFAGVRTGPISWLAEADSIEDEQLNGDSRERLAGLVEGNWRIAQGHNLKFTAESLDPNRDIDEDDQARYSAVYEWTPIQFLQLRGGARVYDGIPQSDLQNRRLYFLELHGFF